MLSHRVSLRRLSLPLLLGVLVLSMSLVTPTATSIAAGPGPSPTPPGTPTRPPTEPGAEPIAPQGGGAQVLLNAPPSCDGGAPGSITTGVFASLNAVILYAEAAETSDFRLETSSDAGTTTPQVVISNATYSVGATGAVPISPDAQSLVFSIFTPTFGQIRRSDSQFAKVVQEAAGVWMFCFEDGVDNDFNDLIVRVWDGQCGNQLLLDPFGDPIRVKYDPRFMWTPTDVDFLQKASWMAEAIRDRAISARTEMSSLYANFGAQAEVDGYNVNIEVNCNGLFGFLLDRPGFTQNQDLIKLHPDFIRRTMAAYVQAKVDGVAAEDLPIAGEPWADLVDHELYHTYQIAANGGPNQLVRYNVLHDYVNNESTAQLSQDLLADSDDLIERTGAVNTSDGSYRDYVDQGLNEPGGVSIVVNEATGVIEYRAGGFFQWLGERYGAGPTLEARVAQFARNVYRNDRVQVGAIGNAIGGTRLDALDSLRDFWVTALVREATNLAAWPNRFRILDESTLHGQPSNFGGPLPALKYGPVLVEDRPLPDNGPLVMQPTTAVIRRYALPPGTALLSVAITDNSEPTVIPNGWFPVVIEPDRVRLASLPTLANGDVVLEPSYFTSGPARTKSETYTVAAAGMDNVTLVMVAGENEAELQLDVTAVSGALAMSIDAVTTFGNALVVRARPSVGNVFARQQPESAFSVRVDGTLWPSKVVVDLGDGATIILPGASALAAGQHEVEVTYQLGTQSVTTTETFDVPGSLAPMSLTSASVELPVVRVGGSGLAGDPLELSAVPAADGEPVAGASVTATVVDPLGVARSFDLADHGSQLDGAVGDGAYGAEVFGTSAAGTYEVTFVATGVWDGVPFSTSRSASWVLGPIVDSDSDGVSDAMEERLGLNPADPTDGSADLDLDGAGTAAELTRGSDPMSSDTDGGGEADGSELAAGNDPLASGDDAVIASLAAGATAVDGRLVDISMDFTPDTATARLYRVQAGEVTDLGLRTGDQTFTDGPLLAGTYSYRVVVETGTGRRGPIAGIGPVDARDDATAPQAMLAITGGTAVTNQMTVPVQFAGVTGSPTEMRLAESEDGLSAAPWVPYLGSTTFELENVDGIHTIWAQLRDAAGNVSLRLAQSITLDVNPPTSTAGPLPAYTLSSGVSVPFVASDDRDLALVELWSRYRATSTAPWGAWGRRTMGQSSPIFLTLGANGFYQVATVAVDLAGNREALPADGDAEIRVGPEIVNDDAGTADQQNPRATIGLDGLVYAVWRDARNSSSIYDLYFASRDAATGNWSANERVDDSGSSVNAPGVAVDAAGNAYAIWVDSRGGDPDIWFSKREAATGTWSASVRVNDDTAGSTQSAPVIAVSSTGEAIAAWVDGRSRKANIYSARLAPGATTWSANYKVSSNGTLTKAAPDLAIGSDGVAYAVYSQYKNGLSSIRFATLATGATAWATDVLVSDNSYNELAGQIRVDAAGNLLLTGQRGSSFVWARYRLAGSADWSTATYVSSTSNAFSSSLSMRGSGVAYVVWTDINSQVYGARWDPITHAWGSQQQLTSSGTHQTPSVALDATSAVVVTADYATTYDIRGYPTAVP